MADRPVGRTVCCAPPGAGRLGARCTTRQTASPRPGRGWISARGALIVPARATRAGLARFAPSRRGGSGACRVSAGTPAEPGQRAAHAESRRQPGPANPDDPALTTPRGPKNAYSFRYGNDLRALDEQRAANIGLIIPSVESPVAARPATPRHHRQGPATATPSVPTPPSPPPPPRHPKFRPPVAARR